MTKLRRPLILIRNVVASFSLMPAPLDLEKIHYAFRKESIWNDATFNYGVVVFRVQKPKMSFRIYQTGKVICAGARRIDDAEQSDEYLVHRLKEAGFNVRKKTAAKIQNIVATVDLGKIVDIEEFLHNIQNEQIRVVYEPEQFPGAIVKFPVDRGSMATVLLFSSGKLVCVGLTTYDHIRKAIQLLNSKLKS